MEQEKETVKIITFNGRVITLTISERTALKISGLDKYGDSVILPISDIKSMLPIRGEKHF